MAKNVHSQVTIDNELMILPIAYVFKDDSIWADKSSIARIEYWYWCSIFGGAYRERPNERCIRDIKNLFKWLKGFENRFESLEKSILNDSGYSDLNTLLLKDEDHPVTSAIGNAILQYILSKQPKDFLPSHEVRLNTWDIANKKCFKCNGKTRHLEIHDHHIYPLGSATTIGESSRTIRGDKKNILNSPLNRTYISSVSNKIIRDISPDKYLKYISKSTQWGHCIPVKVFSENVADKTTDEQYKVILEWRYEEILRDITVELEKLKLM